MCCSSFCSFRNIRLSWRRFRKQLINKAKPSKDSTEVRWRALFSSPAAPQLLSLLSPLGSVHDGRSRIWRDEGSTRPWAEPPSQSWDVCARGDLRGAEVWCWKSSELWLAWCWQHHSWWLLISGLMKCPESTDLKTEEPAGWNTADISEMIRCWITLIPYRHRCLWSRRKLTGRVWSCCRTQNPAFSSSKLWRTSPPSPKPWRTNDCSTSRR